MFNLFKGKNESNDNLWMDYDSQWLVKLAQEQYPENSKLTNALIKCKKAFKESEAYIYFIDSRNPNQPESKWQFKDNILLESEKEGILVLDIMKDGEIGGIEFLDKL